MASEVLADRQVVAETPEHITPEVMTDLLRGAGVLPEGHVVNVRFSPVGVGLLGDTVRFEITYDADRSTAPLTLAAKFAAKDPVARRTGIDLGLYLTETRFYQELAQTLAVRAPRCYHASISDGGEFCILLEDVSPARAANQVTGCSRADAEHAMRQAAAIHAPTFGDSNVWDVPWMKARRAIFSGVAANFDAHLAEFRRRYSDLLEPEYMRLAQNFASKVSVFVEQMPERFSLIHADFRLDNMLFDANGGADPLVILDWQSVAPENPALDFAYFLGTSYPVDHRRRDEDDLLRLYHDTLLEQGQKDYGIDDIRQDYRRGAWLGLFTAIFSSAVAKRTERGDQVFMTMARGAAAQMLDHETLKMK
ncbi:phosphotransferase [Sphingomonas sp. ID0503]|uniref:phosphotransferase n=1 Tax=Sphingomonas sp. ID0503 TaxID=3399691 RepID=UPI003AFB624B